MLYYSLVYTHLNYCVSTWGGITKTALNPIFTLQKKVLRIITNSSFDSPSRPIFCQLGILPLHLIYKLNLVIFMHKIHNGKIPAPSQLNLIKNIHGHNTRLANQQNYYQNFNRLNIGQYSYLSQGLNVWKEVPINFKNLPLFIFKKQMKNYYLEILNNETQNYLL